MAKNITLMGASYPDVPSVVLPKTGGGTAEFYDSCSVTYSLTAGAAANVTPDRVVTGEGLCLRLSVPAGYVLSGVSVTMGGVDITSQVFAYDEDSGGGGGTAAISVVDTTDTAGGTIRTITALDISDTTAVAADVAQGKYFYTALGVKTAGTASGGTPSATSHTIYFEFSDSTDTTITAYWDGTFISDAITATTPTTYGQKTVTLAQLDGVTWYEPANIPIGVELIDYTKVTNGVYIGEDGEEYANEWSLASDYTLVDPTMTFSYTGWYWYYVGVYDSNKNFLRAIYVYTDGTADPNDGNTAHGVLSGNELLGASYIRLCGTEANSSKMSLIRTA